MKVVDVNASRFLEVLEGFKESKADGSILCVLVISHTSKTDDNHAESVKGTNTCELCI